MQTESGKATSTMALRLPFAKRRLIEAAAAQKGVLVSHWLRDVAVEAARAELGIGPEPDPPEAATEAPVEASIDAPGEGPCERLRREPTKEGG